MNHERQQVWIWDPNPFNPYGVEVARVIATAGYRVRISARAGSDVRAEGVKHWALLPDPASGRFSVSHRLKYAAAISAFFLNAIVYRATVVVAWANTNPERAAVRLIQILGLRTVVVLHNPIPERETVPTSSLRYRMRRRATLRIVHTDELLPYAGPHSAVAAHPAYLAWYGALKRIDSSATLSPPIPRPSPIVLFLGAMRDDKGIQHLAVLDERLTEQGGLLALCVGRAGKEGHRVLEECSSAWKITDGTSYIPDRTVVEALRLADVLVAPYRDVTASGTALMALTVGTPVATFASQSMRKLLDRRMIASSSSLDDLLLTVTSASKVTPVECRALAETADLVSRADWTAALEKLHARR